MCTPAPTCVAALKQASDLWPTRSRASDGICASPQHTQQNPNSDHETGDAFDLTHDPLHGCDAHALAEQLRLRRDPRVKYLISLKRIARSYDKPGIPAWEWAPYTGINPHDKHIHVSVKSRDDTSPWWEEEDLFTDTDRQTLANIQGFAARWDQSFFDRFDKALTKILTASTSGGLTDADRALIAGLRDALVNSPLNPGK